MIIAIGRRLVLAALFVLALSPSVRSDELADFHAAVEEAAAEYRADARVANHTGLTPRKTSDGAPMLLLKADARVRRRDVDEAQLHAFVTVPAVEAQRAGGVHPLTTALGERDPQFLSGRAKRDGIDDRPIA